jgi:hypothetical protein
MDNPMLPANKANSFTATRNNLNQSSHNIPDKKQDRQSGSHVPVKKEVLAPIVFGYNP